jgi:hypothetical protein
LSCCFEIIIIIIIHIFILKVLNGKRQGNGRYSLRDGTVFEGNFHNGVVDGFGKIMWLEDGGGKPSKVYIGEWENGHMHGYGIMFWPGKWSYAGEFVQDERTGVGRCEWREGGYYDGFWRDGVIHGEEEGK